MNILGNGCISGGKYNEEISVLGNATIKGNLHCDSFICTGLVQGKSELICDNNLHIVGNDVFVEFTKCARVVGDNVKIGKNCVIDCVQYKDTIDIHENSVVKKIEKI